jgi:glutamyl-tRNA reductase
MGVRERVIVQTCNRLEVYGVGPVLDRLWAQGDKSGLMPPQAATLQRYGQSRTGAAAVGHLLRLVCGLESQMLGETEILGQIKTQYHAALQGAWTGPVLNKLFQKSFQVAKWIRTHTDIGRGQVSVGCVAAEVAQRIFGQLQHARILLLGAGEVGQKALQALVWRGARQVTVVNRTWDRALALAQRHGAHAVPWGSGADLIGQLRQADIVLGAFEAPQALVTHAVLQEALAQRSGRPCFLIDCAVPRCIDPECARLWGVYVYNLDDLAQVAQANWQQRQEAFVQAEGVLGQRTDALWQALQGRLGAWPAQTLPAESLHSDCFV